MNNKVKYINIKKHTYYFFDDIINIKDFDLNNIKIDEKSYRTNLIYYIAYVTIVTIKGSKYVKINSVNPVYLMLTLVPTNESKEKKIKKYEKLWIKITDLIRLVTKNQMIIMKNI